MEVHIGKIHTRYIEQVDDERDQCPHNTGYPG